MISVGELPGARQRVIAPAVFRPVDPHIDLALSCHGGSMQLSQPFAILLDPDT
jgi:hypothetical protein